MQTSPSTPGTEWSDPAEPAVGPGSFQLADLLLMFGVMALCFVLLRSWRRRARRRPDAPSTPEEVVRRALPMGGAGPELDRRAAEATRLVRDLSAALDTKAARLEVLIEQADERLARLEDHGEAA